MKDMQETESEIPRYHVAVKDNGYLQVSVELVSNRTLCHPAG